MKRFLFLVLIVFVGVSVFANETSSDGKKKSDEKHELYYEANSITSRDNNKVMVLTGDCRLIYDNVYLEASEIVYHVDKKYLEAIGNVRFKELTGDREFVALALNYDMKEDEINVYHYRMYITDSKGYTSGEHVRIDKKNTARSEKSVFTTCDSMDPGYSLHMYNTKMVKDKYIFTYPVVVYLGKIPVFALPAYYVPTPKGKKAGFLRPSYENSETDGWIVSNAFYLPFAEWMDLTYQLKYYQKRGYEHYGDFRYLLRHGDGWIRGHYMHDRKVNSSRWDLNVEAKYRLLLTKSEIQARGNLASDTLYNQNFGQNVEQTTNNAMMSHVTWNQPFGNYGSIRATVERTESWRYTAYNDATERRLEEKMPKLSLTVNTIKPFTFLSLTGTGEFLDVYKESHHEERNATGMLSASLQHKVLFLDFVETASLTRDYYWRNYADEIYVNKKRQNPLMPQEFALARFVSKFSASVGAKVVGYFNLLDIGSTNTIKHSIEPAIAFSYVPKVSQPNFKEYGIGVVAHSEQISYTLNNVFFIKNVNSQVHEFFRVTNAIGYNLLADNFKYSDLNNTFVIRPYINMDFNTTITFNHAYDVYAWHTKNLTGNIITTGKYPVFTSHSTPRHNEISFSGSFSKNYEEENASRSFSSSMRLNTVLWVTPLWSTGIDIMYNPHTNKISSRTYRIYRDLRCADLTFEMIQDTYDKTTLRFFLKLKAYESVKWRETMEY